MLTRPFGSKQGNFVPLYHTLVMQDLWAYNFETMWSSTLFLHIIRFARSYTIFEHFQNFNFFWHFSIKKNQNFNNSLTPICAGGSIKKWVYCVSRDKDGDTRIWVPGLTLSSSITRKWWNCILIYYVPSHKEEQRITDKNVPHAQ